MREYIIKRLLQVIPTILMITLVVFAMMQAIPGDPLMALLGDAYDEEDAEILRQEYGLNKPIVSQYFIWLVKLVQGDWGESFISGPPGAAGCFDPSAGHRRADRPGHAGGADHRHPRRHHCGAASEHLGRLHRHVHRLGGHFDSRFLSRHSVAAGLPRWRSTGCCRVSAWVYLPGTCPSLICEASVGGNLKHVMMPAIALGVGRAAILTRLLRASLLEIIRMEYVTTARAKGLAEKFVILKHALKNALIPTVTIMGLQVGFMIGGAIVVETLFSIPGLGTYGINAIILRDYQQVQGFILLVAVCFVVVNVLVDLTYSLLDPRIRYNT